MAKNINNPLNIKPGDIVRLRTEWEAKIDRTFPVASVSGELGNQVFCVGLGRNHYASEFIKSKVEHKAAVVFSSGAMA